MSSPTRSFWRGAAIALIVGLAPVHPTLAKEKPAAIESRIETMKPGQYVWQPERATSGPVEIVISLPLQRAYIYRGGTLIGASTVSSGKPGHDTPVGVFPILQKRKEHYSNRYDNAPMPFMQRLNWYGVALHGGAIPGHPASHGCVRLPTKFAQKLYEVTTLGSRVIISDDAPADAQAALAIARSSASL